MSEKPLNIHEIKASFSYYAKQVLKGKSFIIAMRNKPFAELRPLASEPTKKLIFGVLKDKFKVPEDFDHPLVDFEAKYYDQ